MLGGYSHRTLNGNWYEARCAPEQGDSKRIVRPKDDELQVVRYQRCRGVGSTHVDSSVRYPTEMKSVSQSNFQPPSSLKTMATPKMNTAKAYLSSSDASSQSAQTSQECKSSVLSTTNHSAYGGKHADSTNKRHDITPIIDPQTPAGISSAQKIAAENRPRNQTRQNYVPSWLPHVPLQAPVENRNTDEVYGNSLAGFSDERSLADITNRRKRLSKKSGVQVFSDE